LFIIYYYNSLTFDFALRLTNHEHFLKHSFNITALFKKKLFLKWIQKSEVLIRLSLFSWLFQRFRVAWSKLVLERAIVFGIAHAWLKSSLVKPKIRKPLHDDLIVVPDSVDSDDDDPEPVIYVPPNTATTSASTHYVYLFKSLRYH
jgi:hypothetical protein